MGRIKIDKAEEDKINYEKKVRENKEAGGLGGEMIPGSALPIWWNNRRGMLSVGQFKWKQICCQRLMEKVNKGCKTNPALTAGQVTTWCNRMAKELTFKKQCWYLNFSKWFMTIVGNVRTEKGKL